MNTVGRRLTVSQAQDLLKQLRVMYGDELNLRVIFELSDEKVGDVMSALKIIGYSAHPESSAYAEREIVVTSKM